MFRVVQVCAFLEGEKATGYVFIVEEVMHSDYSMLERYGFLQHSGAVYYVHEALIYHKYVVLEGKDPRRAVVLTRSTSFGCLDAAGF